MVNRFGLAACVAKSNLGMSVSDRDQERSLSASSIQDSMNIFYSIIESDEMESSIEEEIQMWYERFQSTTDDQLIGFFGKQFPIITGAVQ